jgi:hypothetical protein
MLKPRDEVEGVPSLQGEVDRKVLLQAMLPLVMYQYMELLMMLSLSMMLLLEMMLSLP